jgi:hypothetical protein
VHGAATAGRHATKKPGGCRALEDDVCARSGYFDDFFADDLRAEDFFADDLRAEDFAADFLAPVDLRALDDFFAALFLLVAGDFAIAVFLSVPLQKGHGNRISRHDEEITKRHVPSNRVSTIATFIHWLFDFRALKKCYFGSQGGPDGWALTEGES